MGAGKGGRETDRERRETERERETAVKKAASYSSCKMDFYTPYLTDKHVNFVLVYALCTERLF